VYCPLSASHFALFVAVEVFISSAATVRARIESSLDERFSSTLLLRERMAPQMVTTGVPELDAFIGGLPRGALSEITGKVSSGRTGVMLSALAAATQREEVAGLVDASDSFDPASAHIAGIELKRLLWVRCGDPQRLENSEYARNPGRRQKSLHRLDQVLRVTDLLLQSGGFGMVALDLGDLPAESVRRVPLTSWFRFRRAVEQTATVLLLVEQEPCAKTCASLVVQLERQAIRAQNAVSSEDAHNVRWRVLPSSAPAIPVNNAVSHAALLQGIRLRAEVVRSWTRKPVQSAQVNFQSSVRYR
jgi:hypothetical protein